MILRGKNGVTLRAVTPVTPQRRRLAVSDQVVSRRVSRRRDTVVIPRGKNGVTLRAVTPVTPQRSRLAVSDQVVSRRVSRRRDTVVCRLHYGCQTGRAFKCRQRTILQKPDGSFSPDRFRAPRPGFLQAAEKIPRDTPRTSSSPSRGSSL